MAAKIKLRLHATIRNRGDGTKFLEYRKPEYVTEQLQQYPDNRAVIVTVEATGAKRSNQQNSYLWGVVYPIIAEATGYSENEVHEWAKTAYLKPHMIKIKNKVYPVTTSTTSLTVSDMVEYIDKLCELAVELGSRVPTPSEAGYISNT
jgi:hypothetical protein